MKASILNWYPASHSFMIATFYCVLLNMKILLYFELFVRQVDQKCLYNIRFSKCKYCNG